MTTTAKKHSILDMLSLDRFGMDLEPLFSIKKSSIPKRPAKSELTIPF